MALGINFGIVPLLFLQTTYYNAFYTATILTAWWWLAVIPVLIVGYYSLYIAAYCERRERMILYSILASLCLIYIGLMITNGLTLMISSELWGKMAAQTYYYGAVLGTAHNFEHSLLWWRLATMFGLGLLTTGIWATFDAHCLIRSNANSVPPNYRQWTVTLALLMTFVGAAILTGTEWHLKTMLGTLYYPYFGWVLLLAYTVFVALLLAKICSTKCIGTKFIAIAAALQFATLAVFGVIRQIGQNSAMEKFIDVSKLPEAVQWDTLIAFLVCFLLGVAVIVWMVAQCVKCQTEPAA